MIQPLSKPNIVLIYLDDLGYGDIGCFGSPYGHTPHIDALAASGVRFTDWYSNAPVCSASRAALLTGCYPATTGVRGILGGSRNASPGLRADCPTLAEALKRQGYQTAIFGKWHLGTTPECLPTRRGFDEFFGFLAGCVDYYSHIFYWGMRGGYEGVHDLWENEREVWRNGQYLSDAISDRAVEYIGRGTSEPFFLYLPYNAPHYPLHAPAKYLDRFPNLPEGKRVMAAMIAAVDDGVGRIVDALKQSGQYENTLIFFSSDNGPSNEHANWLNGRQDAFTGSSPGEFRGCKASLFEGGIRVPAIMSWPARIGPGQVSGEVGAMMDIFPTCIEAAGGDVSSLGIEGQSVVDTVTGTVASPHREVFWEYDGQLAVRSGDWKLVLDGKEDFHTSASDSIHLSNLADDPAEQHNVIRDNAAIADALEVKTRAWFASVMAFS